MKIYDISQEVFGCEVYEGDPSPKREVLCSMKNGDLYNLTAFSMCAHNGTHIDAPYHFLDDGKTVDMIPLSSTVGYAYVTQHSGDMTASDANDVLSRAKACPSSPRKILIKGVSTITADAARVFADERIELIGVESQTVGPECAPAEVHRILLGAGVVLLEGIRLCEVCEGEYLLNAAPINLSGADGAPCRALLIEK